MQRRLWIPWIGVAALMGMALSGCGQVTTTSAPTAVQTAAQARTSTAMPALSGSAVSPFSVKTLDGQTYAVTAAPGHPVVLYFMAAWCGSCMPEARALAQIEQKYAAQHVDVLVLDVDPGDTAAELTTFKQTAGLERHWALDAGSAVTKAYKVTALDTTIVIDARGHVVQRNERPMTFEALDQLLKRVL
ncbi:MAG: TlpA disulfide reductase family protein [Herpetosiphon sp.]